MLGYESIWSRWTALIQEESLCSKEPSTSPSPTSASASPSYGAIFLPFVVVVARNLFIHQLTGRFGIASYGGLLCVWAE